MLLYSRKVHIPFSKIIDIIAILAPLGGAFIRISNLMNSEIIGRPTDLPWAFIFTQVDDLPRHPSQLYESLCYFIIFLIAYSIYKDKMHIPADTRSAFPVISVQSPVSIQCCWQS